MDDSSLLRVQLRKAMSELRMLRKENADLKERLSRISRYVQSLRRERTR